MRIYCTVAALAITLSVVVPLVQSATAQQPPANGPGVNAPTYRFAVVDISYIFKHYTKFNSELERMKTDVSAAEGEMRKERDAITRFKENMQAQYAPGSAEFKRADEQLTEMQADFNVKATKQRKEFFDREAKIYYQAYLEINDAVRYIAQRQRLGLVIRFNGDPVDPNNREDVLRAINKPIVYQNNVDITPDVLAVLERDRNAGKPDPRSADRRQIPGQPAR